jgi:hypothetical protein
VVCTPIRTEPNIGDGETSRGPSRQEGLGRIDLGLPRRLTTVRANPAVALLRDGRVLVAGGSQPQGDAPGPSLASAELFHP